MNLSARLEAVGLLRAGQHQQARAILEKLPATPDVLCNLAFALDDAGEHEQAISAFNRAGTDVARCGLGNLFLRRENLPDAAREFQTVLSKNPHDVFALRGLAACKMDEGDAYNATRIMHAAAMQSGLSSDWSNLCFYSLHPDNGKAERWHSGYVASYLGKPAEPPPKTWDGLRPLRIGYVSPHFRRHTATKFIEPILASHSRAVEVFCYSDTTKPDAVTSRIKSYVQHWHDTASMSNDRLAELIRGHGVDVLLDRCDHLDGGQRWGLFARHPAPVLVSYSGHPHPSHFPGMVRITDSIVDPGETGEALARVPVCMRAFRPDDQTPPVSPLPALATGGVTFGSMNRAAKITPAMARLWGDILRAVDGSRLVVLSLGGEKNTGLRRMLVGAGIDNGRLILLPYQSDPVKYLDLFAKVDVHLDTAPYSGTTTICDALYQGVPSVTMLGDTVRGRMGASLMRCVGLGECVATSPQSYVGIAASLANKLPVLASMRAGMRQAMGSLLDGGRVAKAVEGICMGLAG